ncbi:2-hydroxyacid dehydrogenase [Geotoga petraea]|uniref:Phosphoglycerate dehydrogenase n=1 Tax=Geotoga petraea TaxID=28234 RepID=A0A1G6KMD7_9BACT|nr:2-hydroxyacid dehydrogenase [Geotoga petraea]SDC32210.1 Phosphoglycerate dehydrogenase [Geotoga petraea]
MKKILFYTHLFEDFPELIDEIRDKYSEVEFLYTEDEEELKDKIVDINAVVWGHPKESVLEIAKNLEVVFIPFTGVNKLPFEYFKERGLIVSNNHGNGIIVAERAVALSLAVMGRIVEFHNDMKEGEWHRRYGSKNPFDLWTSLQNKNVSILGTGGIGKNIARLLKGFNCNIMGYKRKINGEMENFDHLTDDLTTALNFGDIIYIALPLTEKTKSTINLENIELLKDKFLINVARGEIVQEEALYKGLNDGILKGAAIDSWYNYPNAEKPYELPSKYNVHRFKNIVISPHAASHSFEGKKYQLEYTIENIEYYLDNGKPKYVVNLEEKY